MLVDDILEQQKLVRARTQPCLWFTGFSVPETLQEVRTRHFPQLERPPEIYAVNRGPLACIVCSERIATIYVHQILNHSDTPVEVFSLVCKHELLHLEIAAAEVAGKKTWHPPEFWEAEKRIAPERTAAWTWIWVNLELDLKRRRRLERIDVLPSWRKGWASRRASLRDCIDMCRRSPLSETEESGW